VKKWNLLLLQGIIKRKLVDGKVIIYLWLFDIFIINNLDVYEIIDLNSPGN